MKKLILLLFPLFMFACDKKESEEDKIIQQIENAVKNDKTVCLLSNDGRYIEGKKYYIINANVTLDSIRNTTSYPPRVDDEDRKRIDDMYTPVNHVLTCQVIHNYGVSRIDAYITSDFQVMLCNPNGKALE